MRDQCPKVRRRTGRADSLTFPTASVLREPGDGKARNGCRWAADGAAAAVMGTGSRAAPRARVGGLRGSSREGRGSKGLVLDRAGSQPSPRTAPVSARLFRRVQLPGVVSVLSEPPGVLDAGLAAQVVHAAHADDPSGTPVPFA